MRKVLHAPGQQTFTSPFGDKNRQHLFSGSFHYEYERTAKSVKYLTGTRHQNAVRKCLQTRPSEEKKKIP